MHIVLLVNEALQSAAHRDNVVVGVRAEHDYTLGIGVGALGTVGVVGVGFAAGPAGDGMLKIVKYFDVDIVGRAIEGEEFAEAPVCRSSRRAILWRGG